MKKKKPIIITTAVIILCIITLILGIKVVQKKKEVQTKQELIQSQQDLISYIKNDGMNVENKDIYIIRIEKTTTKEELDPIRQEYEKETDRGYIDVGCSLFDEYTAGRGVYTCRLPRPGTVGDNGAYHGLERRHYVEYLCFPAWHSACWA